MPFPQLFYSCIKLFDLTAPSLTKLAVDDVDLTLPEFPYTTSRATTTPDIAGGRCECRSGSPAGGSDCGGHCHHCRGDEEEKQGLRTAAVDRGSCVYERCV